MKKHSVRAKFNKENKIICCSQTMCVNCRDINKCEELDIYIKKGYEDSDMNKLMKAPRVKEHKKSK